MIPPASVISDSGENLSQPAEHIPRYTELIPNPKDIFSGVYGIDGGIGTDAAVIQDAQPALDAQTSTSLDAMISIDSGILPLMDAGNLDSGTSSVTPDAGAADAGPSLTDAGGVTTSSCAVATSTSSPFLDANPCLGGQPSHSRQFGYIATGQAWGDFDNDGWLDLYVTSASGSNTLYRNLGDGRFSVSMHSASVSLSGSRSGGAVFADYDNDGYKDLYVLNYGANTLFHNDGGNGFTDVTSTSSTGDTGKGITAAWGDYDNDGLLDLYVSNMSCPDCVQPSGLLGSRDRLYHNDGQGRFTDVTLLLGYYNTLGYAYAASFLDFDNDGDLDIYVANDRGRAGAYIPGSNMNRNILFRNNGPGCNGWCFSEVGTFVGADARVDGMGLAIGDYDYDGDLDIYCTHTGNPVLLQNDGTGRFTDVAVAAGANYFSVSWGAFFFDYDNDADQDLYVAIGLEFWGLTGNRLFQNQGAGMFTDVTDPLQLGHIGESVGAAYADYDNDGAVDFIVGNWGQGYNLYRNASNAPGNWVRYRLVGGNGVNRDAIGARVTIRLDNGETLMQEVKSGSSLGAGNDIALHFGLGNARISVVQIRWPDGTLEFPPNPPLNQEILHAQP